jgi:hypothetical protein
MGRGATVACALAAWAAAPPLAAQELEPRAYSPSPVGANLLLVAYGRTSGDVVFDPSVPLTDVSAAVNAGTLFYARTFALLGRSASAAVVLPYAWGDVEGNVFEERRRVHRSGLADTRFRLAVNLVGGPALTPAAFAQRTPQTTLGASLVVVAPTGQYDPSKLVNIGANRWIFKPELGLSKPAGRFLFDVYAGAWLFADNPDYFGGSHREQDPLLTFQGHVSYTVKPRFWVAANATYYTGGRTTLDGVEKADLQRNSRYGVTVAVPIQRRSGVKASWSRGLTTRIGGDFETLALGYQFIWF